MEARMEHTDQEQIPAWGQNIIARILAVVFSLLIIGMVLMVFLQVVNRYYFNNPLSWTEEVARILFIWITFLGTYWAMSINSHIGVSSFIDWFSSRVVIFAATVVNWLLVFYLIYFFVIGVDLVRESHHTLTPALNIPFSYIYSVMPLSAALMLWLLAARLWRSERRRVLFAALVTAAVLTGLHLAFGGGKIGDVALILVTVGCLIAMIIIHTPIAFALGLSALLFLILQDRTPLMIVPSRMVGGVDSFPLLAVPFFILAGELMNSGGITQRLVNLAKILVGHIRGGLGMVVVVAEYFFSGISGSTVADVSAIGSLLIPAMKKAGYTPENSVAIVSAAAAMGILVPPCISMVVLGCMAGLSVGSLFMAGFLPAAVLALCIMALIYYQAMRSGLAVEARPTLKTAAKSILDGVIPLLLPVILFGGILSGMATATEVSVLAVIYGFLVGAFLYREIKPGDIVPILIRTITMTGTVMFLIAAASVLSWVFATNQVPKKIGEFILFVSTSPWVFLVMANVVFILLGAVLEGLPALILLVPIFFPLLDQFGINPVHFGILVVAALGIGTFLPPVGMGIFIACNFAGIGIGRAARSFWPFLLVLFIGLLIISFVPWFTLILPSIFFSS